METAHVMYRRIYLCIGVDKCAAKIHVVRLLVHNYQLPTHPIVRLIFLQALLFHFLCDLHIPPQS